MNTVTQRLQFSSAIAALVVSAWAGSALALSTNSSPIALTSDAKQVWSVNPDNDSVSVFNVEGDANVRLAEIPVEDEPQCVAITPDDKTAYVTNQVSGTVSVIDVATRQIVRRLKVGAEPFGCALTPDGQRLFVANHSSDSVSVINTKTNRVAKTISNVGPKPRGIGITNDGTVYVTQFLAQLRNDSRPIAEKEGVDDGKEGRVTIISAATLKVLGTVVLNPIANTGFTSRGQTLSPTGPILFDVATQTPQVVTGAFPNLLQSIVVKGNRAYLPNTCSSPNGPVRFNVNVQSCMSVFDITTNLDSGQTINMNTEVVAEDPTTKLFITNPLALAFKPSANEGFVVAQAINQIVEVELDANGTPTINGPTPVRVNVGKSPHGIVMTDTRAYVANLISRDVTAVDLTTNPPTKLADIESASQPTPGTLEAAVHLGHELFNTGIGPAGDGTVPTSAPPAGRMSDTGWGSCYGCHPNGLADGVTWVFAAQGPRQTISMESTAAHPQEAIVNVTVNENFAPLLPTFHQRALNWSAVRDECQDFELNIRNVSGGQGLIRDGQAVVDLTPTANTGRDPDLDKLCAYIAFGIRVPISPSNGQFQDGRRVFSQANCQSCHGGINWSSSKIDFTPPPDPLLEPIVVGQLTDFLNDVGTFDITAFNEFKAGAVAGQLNADRANGELGFNNPSLLSIFASAPYFHSGAAPTLEDVIASAPRNAKDVHFITSAKDRSALLRFLKSIDADTEPIE